MTKTTFRNKLKDYKKFRAFSCLVFAFNEKTMISSVDCFDEKWPDIIHKSSKRYKNVLKFSLVGQVPNVKLTFLFAQNNMRKLEINDFLYSACKLAKS